MHPYLKKILFSLPPEIAHTSVLWGLRATQLTGLTHLFSNPPIVRSKQLMGLKFPNHVGLAAGFDKNGDYIDALAALGFGFLEIGTVTPKPQKGNPKPRLFRLTQEEAIINRMGFNNKGIDHVVKNLKKMTYMGILGINIGKNKDTPLENAVDDYLLGFRAFWKFASYITINISSPNTPGLRDLQHEDLLENLLHTLKQEQHSIFMERQKYVPLIVKISPDLNDEELHALARILLKEKMDGVIATNTTIDRTQIQNSKYAKETGGLSGLPLRDKSTKLIERLHSMLENKIPIIASGGVMDKKSAEEKMRAGASLVQIYSGFIYSGPKLIADLV